MLQVASSSAVVELLHWNSYDYSAVTPIAATVTTEETLKMSDVNNDETASVGAGFGLSPETKKISFNKSILIVEGLFSKPTN